MGDWDLSPDGQRAVTIRRDPGDTQDRDIIWLNFFEELRQVVLGEALCEGSLVLGLSEVRAGHDGYRGLD